MVQRTIALALTGLLISAVGAAKDKAKNILPPYVLSARTVAVIIDPSAGISIDDPQANREAQRDVEAALLKWGRFEPQLSNQGADLIIVVRRGHGRLVDPTISDPRQGNRPGSVTSTDNGIGIAEQHGPQPQFPGGPIGSTGDQPHPQTEIGGADDSFVVYQGGVPDPLDAPPAWRYTAPNGLLSPSVPAVEEFRKAISAAEKAAAKKP